MRTHGTIDADLLVGLVKRAHALAELRSETLDHRELARRLDVSIATSYRLAGWLAEAGVVTDADGALALTALGQVIADTVAEFETDVRTALGPTAATPELLVELVRRSPMLDALRGGRLDRRELEARLNVSRATGHRHTRSLGEMSLIERTGGTFALTALGEAVADAVSTFETNGRTALVLAPALEAIRETTTDFDVGIFADTTVTSAERGDAYGPMTRFVSLLEETETLRGFDTFSIAPTYAGEFQQRILDGMETEIIDPPAVTENVMNSYPEKCVQVCASEHFTLWIHDDLPYGLAIFDDRVGIGVRDTDARTLRAFVDTDSAAAREWAEAVYESYRNEAVRLESFTKRGLREAMAAM
ncbi:helix-turn-helix transcriptional regulator [Halomarina pelagica]|uniref:helix-turn-helix transcriptional regulator n=1 Tax=Halomarina pelagica TaxID=2961599 RepID=UPI0020C1F0DE|nr:MarR family transcriptional regulator [Halomarina sp. BND7]